MSATPTRHETGHLDARWEDWRIRNAAVSHRAARRSLFAAIVVLSAAAAWPLVELMSSPAFA